MYRSERAFVASQSLPSKSVAPDVVRNRFFSATTLRQKQIGSVRKISRTSLLATENFLQPSCTRTLIPGTAYVTEYGFSIYAQLCAISKVVFSTERVSAKCHEHRQQSEADVKLPRRARITLCVIESNAAEPPETIVTSGIRTIRQRRTRQRFPVRPSDASS